MSREKIDLGFGVEIEVIKNELAKIHNLKSNKESVRNLGVKIFN